MGEYDVFVPGRANLLLNSAKSGQAVMWNNESDCIRFLARCETKSCLKIRTQRECNLQKMCIFQGGIAQTCYMLCKIY